MLVLGSILGGLDIPAKADTSGLPGMILHRYDVDKADTGTVSDIKGRGDSVLALNRILDVCIGVFVSRWA